MYGINDWEQFLSQEESPQLVQGLLGSASEPNHILNKIISDGANKAAQLGQFAQMVNPAASNELNAMPQAHNPYALNMKRDIVQAKKAYDNATTDEARAAAQAQTAFLRDISNSAGIDLSGYGSDVSLADAYKNLYSQQAQDSSRSFDWWLSSRPRKISQWTFKQLRGRRISYE